MVVRHIVSSILLSCADLMSVIVLAGSAVEKELVYKLEWLNQRSLKLDRLLSITLSNKRYYHFNKPRKSHPDQIHSLITDHILQGMWFQGMWFHGQNFPTCDDTSKFVRPDQIHPDQIYNDRHRAMPTVSEHKILLLNYVDSRQ